MNYYVENYNYSTQFQWFTSPGRFSLDAHEKQILLTENLEALFSGPHWDLRFNVDEEMLNSHGVIIFTDLLGIFFKKKMAEL